MPGRDATASLESDPEVSVPRNAKKVTVGQGSAWELGEQWTVGVIALGKLARGGFFEALGERLRLVRKSGCNGVQLFCQLLLMALCGRLGQRAVQRLAAGHVAALATVAGGRWYGQSATSRALASLGAQQAESVSDWLLQEALPLAAVERDTSAMHRDSFGAFWRVLDVDGRVRAIRQRGLPEGEELPASRRLAATLAAPGYPGRKRGETQMHQMALCDAGTGRYVGVRVAPGNGDHVQEMQWAARSSARWAERLKISPQRMVMRFDGKSVGAPCLLECLEAGINFVARWSEYTVLDSTELTAHLAGVHWQAVPDSGSGPRREATELGIRWLNLFERWTKGDGARKRMRVVVSRYPQPKGPKHRGCGRLVDGYVYELFCTSLPVPAWPAGALVGLYYGRSTQECRFGRTDDAHPTQHILSWHLPGQHLFLAVCYFAWNLRLLWGTELAPWRPEPLPPQEAADPKMLPPAVPAEPSEALSPDGLAQHQPTLHNDSPPPVGKGDSPPPVGKDECRNDDDNSEGTTRPGRLASWDWPSLLEHRPGWQWSEQDLELRCPAGKPMLVHAIRPRFTAGTAQIVFRLRHRKACSTCSIRGGCTTSTNPRFFKDLWLTIPLAQAPAAPTRGSRPCCSPRAATVEASTPSVPSRYRPPESSPAPGPWTPSAPALLPAVLRNLPNSRLQGWRVVVQIPPVRHKPTVAPWISTGPAQRQHRRRTYAQRRVAAGLTTQPPPLQLIARAGVPAKERRSARRNALSAWKVDAIR